jgi:hypothetical protein
MSVITITNMNSLQYVLPEHGIKINYPSSWEKGDRNTSVIPPPFVAVFAPPVESTPASYREFIGISITDNPTNSIKEIMDAHIESITKSESNSEIIESSPTTIQGSPAYQLIYLNGDGIKILAVVTKKENKVYSIMYFSRPKKYQEYLSAAEQMISSFEFLQK